MVSQTDHLTSLTVRDPTLVVSYGGGGSSSSEAGHRQNHRGPSSHVSSRAKRYNRSHAGGGSGSSYIPQNEFPVFSHSGDVEILVRVASGHENRYLLHRHTLTRCSGFFEASTSNQWSRAQLVAPVDSLLSPPASATATIAIEGPGGKEPLATVHELDAGYSGGDVSARVVATPTATTPPRKRWRYELDWGKGDDDIPMLVQKEESSAAPAPAPAPLFGGGRQGKSVSFFRSVANLSLSASPAHVLPPPTQTEQHVLRDYDNLFRIMYNYPPILDGINIADAYVQCKSLLTLADQYDALAVVGPRVDHHLLQFQSRLWKQIAKYPISYLRLGYLAQSRIMFQEALVHVVGQWPAGERSLRAALPDVVLDLIEDKVDELEETVARVEARLFRLTLTTRAGERVAPATGYLDWLALSLFRQWLADNIAPVVSPTPPPAAGSRGQTRDARTREASSGSTSVVSAAGHRTSYGGSGGRGNHGTRSSHARALVTLAPPLASLGRTYRTLGGCGSGSGTTAAAAAAAAYSYLGHDDCKRFLKLTPDLYSRENLRRFEKRIDELKAMAREVVRPLMGSGLELEVGPGRSEAAASIGYLTCTHLADRDLPWDVYD